MLSPQERRDWLGLWLTPGIGPVAFWQLLERFGSAGAVLEASGRALQHQGGLRPAQATELEDRSRLRQWADRELSRLERLGARMLIAGEPDYPELLGQCAVPPPLLFVRGSETALKTPAAAVIGSRAATAYGRRLAFSLARDLGSAGVAVVSGLAAGIDAQAHEGCLAGGGATIGVLGCGLDVVYPRSNRELYRRMTHSGVLVTEYPLGTKPEGFRFPARNRIIAGLSHGVVVVEAAPKSGSLITVQHALEEGREVAAVPGQVDSVKSRGTHWLLQQGAGLVTCGADVLELFGLTPASATAAAAEAKPQPVRLADSARRLLALIEPYPRPRQEVAELSELSAAELSEQLLLLELEGLIELLPGDRVRRSGAIRAADTR